MKIGDKIRQLRGKAGFTQEQLASKLCVSAQAVSKWENEISMPDISLLPNIAEAFGVSIDELFDLTVEQKLKRIENRIEIDEELTPEVFNEYELFLREQLTSGDKSSALSLLANLYHHRMEADSKRVSKYGRDAVLLNPEKKDCQWLLIKAEGHTAWDWNFSNHSSAIDFYKDVIEADKGTPKSTLPYYYLIDNLLADNRASEAMHYLNDYQSLPAHKPVMVDVYRAYIALAEYDVSKADEIITECESKYYNDSIFLFEAAQYFARRCRYDKALEYYERSWDAEKSPRYTDAMHGMATICKILGDKEGAIKAYDKILECLRVEWGYSAEDKPYIQTERDKAAVIKTFTK